MNVLLFGPPGVGKSTIIQWLRDNPSEAPDYDCIDLEALYPSPVRYEIPSMVTNTIMGAADLDPKGNYKGCFKVLMFIPQKKYDERRAQRDAQVPGKSQQARQVIIKWYEPHRFDYILWADGSPAHTAKELMRWINSPWRHNQA